MALSYGLQDISGANVHTVPPSVCDFIPQQSSPNPTHLVYAPLVEGVRLASLLPEDRQADAHAFRRAAFP